MLGTLRDDITPKTYRGLTQDVNVYNAVDEAASVLSVRPRQYGRSAVASYGSDIEMHWLTIRLWI
jgi:hypothetical protein